MRRDPHALQIGRIDRDRLEAPTADRLPIKPGDKEDAARRAEFVKRGEEAEPGIEAAVEAVAELPIIFAKAILGGGAGGRLGSDRQIGRRGHRIEALAFSRSFGALSTAGANCSVVST